MVMITLYARQKKRHRCTEQTFGPYGRRQGWDHLRVFFNMILPSLLEIITSPLTPPTCIYSPQLSLDTALLESLNLTSFSFPSQGKEFLIYVFIAPHVSSNRVPITLNCAYFLTYLPLPLESTIESKVFEDKKHLIYLRTSQVTQCCVGKMPWRKKWQSTLVFLPGKSPGQRNLAEYSSWGLLKSRT